MLLEYYIMLLFCLLLNALLALTKFNALVEESSKMSRIEWIVASAPALKPVAVCNSLADSCMLSCMYVQLIACP